MSQRLREISEFQARHDEITQRIKRTYMVSNRTHEYLIRRTILDYHFRGEQDKFEEEHPELKDKALKMMGPVLYYELSSTCGQPLSGSSKLYE